MTEKYCGSCGGVRIGANQFCIICGSKFATIEVRKCPTCNQDWPDAPSAFGVGESSNSAPVAPSPVNTQQSIILSPAEAKLEGAIGMLVRPIKWSDALSKGKDCLNCGCPASAPVCTVCGFIR